MMLMERTLVENTTSRETDGATAAPHSAADLTSLAESVRRSTVEVRGHRGGSGSGVIWPADRSAGGSASGLIITNAHVVRGRETEVKLSNGRTLDAAVVKIDSSRDLAALRFEAVAEVGVNDLPAAPIGDSDSLRVGEIVLAVGNPFGTSGAVTVGIVHAAGATARAIRRAEFRGVKIRRPRRWIEADVRLAPGNSGGPLVNAQGRVIGINTMIAGGLALAVPSNVVRRFVRDLQRRQAAPRLGVNVRPINVSLGDESVLGLMVMEVHAGSRAAEAGLIIGDVLLSVRGLFFTAPDDLADALNDSFNDPLNNPHSNHGEAQLDDVLRIDLLRGGVPLTCDVPLGARAEEMAEAA